MEVVVQEQPIEVNVVVQAPQPVQVTVIIQKDNLIDDTASTGAGKTYSIDHLNLLFKNLREEIKTALASNLPVDYQLSYPTIFADGGIDESNAPQLYRGIDVDGTDEELNYILFNEKLPSGQNGFIQFAKNSKNSYIGLTTSKTVTDVNNVSADLKVGIFIFEKGGYVRTKDNDSFYTKGFNQDISGFDGRSTLSNSSVSLRLGRTGSIFTLSQSNDGVVFTPVYQFNWVYSGDLYIACGIIDGGYPNLENSRVIELKQFGFA